MLKTWKRSGLFLQQPRVEPPFCPFAKFPSLSPTLKYIYK